MTIVVTGFEAFLDHDVNPTQEVIRLLPKSIYGNKLIGVELPVLYGSSFAKLEKILIEEKPEIVICLGLGGGREAITPERIAINLNDANYADNDGVVFENHQILHGKNAYFSTLPLSKIVDNLERKNLPVSISNSAGLYVCNDLMYRLLHYVNQNSLAIKAGFIHVPYMNEQKHPDDQFSLPLHQILEGIIDSIKACL